MPADNTTPKRCPICAGPIRPDTRQDDDDESENFHDFAGYNYKCRTHGTFTIKAR